VPGKINLQLYIPNSSVDNVYLQVRGKILSLNMGNPFSKAKYGALSDSEKYREGKVKE